MEPLPLIIKIPRIERQEDDGEFVLVKVATSGNRPLDLDLIGTDESAVYKLSLKENHLPKLKEKRANLTDETWRIILTHILLGSPVPEDGSAEGLESVARVDDEHMTILIRRRKGGITQTLGTISVPADENQEVSLFDWALTSVSAHDRTITKLTSLQSEVSTQAATIAKLESALSELTTLKSDNETQLLQKFSLLLNEKKLKIRDQQRLLAASTVDPATLAHVQNTRAASHSPGPSRKGKRKAAPKVEDEESDDAFEQMDIDKPIVEDGSDAEPARTPEDSTAEETEGDEEPPLPPPPKAKLGRLNREDDPPKTARSTRAESSKAGAASAEAKALPPPVTLPFQKAPPKAAEPAKKDAPGEDEGSETEDDEL